MINPLAPHHILVEIFLSGRICGVSVFFFLAALLASFNLDFVCLRFLQHEEVDWGLQPAVAFGGYQKCLVTPVFFCLFVLTCKYFMCTCSFAVSFPHYSCRKIKKKQKSSQFKDDSSRQLALFSPFGCSYWVS